MANRCVQCSIIIVISFAMKHHHVINSTSKQKQQKHLLLNCQTDNIITAPSATTININCVHSTNNYTKASCYQLQFNSSQPNGREFLQRHNFIYHTLLMLQFYPVEIMQ
eukprot:335586_1